MKTIFRRIEVAWCAVFMVVPPIWYVVLVAKLIHTGLVSDDVARELGRVTPYLIIVIAIEVYYGVAFARFILRLIPLRLSGGDRIRQCLRLLILAGCLTPLALLYLFLVPTAQLALGVSVAVWLACVLTPLYSAYRKLKRLYQGRFVVFLRKFSTFADRAVIGLVFSQVPPDKSIVVLTPNRSQRGDWNPYLVGFAGIKFRSPVRSMPIVLRAPDSDWETPANSLIDKAHLIVLDVSQGSAAIQKEMMMIENSARWHDAICLKDESAVANPAWNDFILAKAGWLVQYKRNWGQIIPRIIVFLTLAGAGLMYLLSIVNRNSQASSDLEKSVAAAIAVILWIIPFLSGLGLLIYSTFIYPSITLSAKPAIRRALRNVPSDERLIRNFHRYHQEFERLISMSLEDRTNAAPTSLSVISAGATSNKEEPGLSSGRRDQYLGLFHSLELHHGMRLHSDHTFLVSESNIVGRKGCEKGYVYSPNELSPLYNSLDIQSARRKYLFRKLEPNWYLYLYEK